MDFAHKIGTTMSLFNSFQIFTPTTGESPGLFPGQIVSKIAKKCDLTHSDQSESMFNTINGLCAQDRDHYEPFQ